MIGRTRSLHGFSFGASKVLGVERRSCRGYEERSVRFLYAHTLSLCPQRERLDTNLKQIVLPRMKKIDLVAACRICTLTFGRVQL